MDSFPIQLNLTQQRCLIVGGGQIAWRKAQLLAEAGAIVDIISPTILPELQQLTIKTTGQWIDQRYASHYLDTTQYRLVIAATEKSSVNAQVFTDCESRHILVNSVDDPKHSRFSVPAIVDRSPLVISIASNGASPVLSRLLRGQIESSVAANYGQLAKCAAQWRERSKKALPDVNQRRLFWEQFYESSLAQRILAGEDHTTLELLIAQQLADFVSHSAKASIGEVYLVGAGPGDPDLLTFKALRLMQQADIIVYDRLVSLPILARCRRDAQRIYVGKARADHALPQQDINQLLVDLARAGKRVCRLKGGDPFIFGRGGEELELLAQHHIPFQIVPGITAASGCSAYAGIPLTHRDYAQSVRFLTGHLKAGMPELPWHELIYENQTLVLYMGLVGLPEIMQKLIKHGMRENMPVALVSKGTLPQQQVIVGTVSTIADLVAGKEIHAPTLTIIGDVVKLRQSFYQ